MFEKLAAEPAASCWDSQHLLLLVAGADTSAIDSGSQLSGAYACPAPRIRTDVSCQPNRVWARESRSGACCAYEDPCAAPNDWPIFPSEEECQTSCRCAMLMGDGLTRFEQTSLACACQNRFARQQVWDGTHQASAGCS